MGIRALTFACLWVLASIGCGGGGGLPDASLDANGEFSSPLKPRGHILVYFAGGDPQVSATAFVPRDSTPSRQQLVVAFATGIPCAAQRNLVTSLTSESETIDLPFRPVRCDVFTVSIGELVFDLPSDFLARHGTQFASFFLNFRDVASISEPWNFNFFISSRFTSPPEVLTAPSITGVEPRLDAAGWNRPVPSGQLADYRLLPANALAPSTPLMAHQEFRWASTRSGIAAPLTAISALVTPDDLGDGIILEDANTELPLSTQSTGVFRTYSQRGFIPGQLYDLRFVGDEGATDTEGRVVPPTEDENGTGLVTWVDTPARMDGFGARFAFNVYPVRIESPTHRAISGIEATEIFNGQRHLVVRVVVTPTANLPTQFRVTLVGPDGQIAGASGTWPITALSDVVRSLPVPVLMAQARGVYNLLSFEVRVPLPLGWPDGQTTTTIQFGTGPTDGPGFPADRVSTNLDFTAPVIPSACTSATPAGTPCTYYVDGDERDCRVANICFPPGDAVRALISLCGVTRDVVLREQAVPTAPMARMMCTGELNFATPGGTATGASGYNVTLTDAAGNQAASDGDSNTPGQQPLMPTCFVPDRLTPAGWGPSTPLHVRTQAGLPVIVGAVGGTLHAWTHDGIAWRDSVVLESGDSEYRGRIDGFTTPDGTTHFCATHIRLDPSDPFRHRPELDIFRPRGALIAGTISPRGVVRARRVLRTVYPVGCGIVVDGSTTYLGVTGVQIRGRPQIQILECRPSTSGALVCPTEGDRNVGSFGRDGEPVGFEPDVALVRGEFHLVGRGMRIAASAAGPEVVVESSIYDVVIRRTGGAPTLRLPFQERRGGLRGTPLRVIEQGSSPRITAMRTTPVLTFVRHMALPDGWTTDLVGAVGTSAPTVLANIGSGNGPLAKIFPLRERDLALWQSPVYVLPSGTTDIRRAEVPIGYDVAFDGLTLDVGFQRRSMGGRFAVDDRSSVWFQRHFLRGTRLEPLAVGSRRVDVETGAQLDSSRHVALYVNPTAAFSVASESSVVYDQYRPGFAPLLFADSRVGHFVEARPDAQYGGNAAARAPLAVRETLVPAGSCWSATSVLTDMSEPETNLVPTPVLGSWASPRASFTVNQSPGARHRIGSGAAECALRDEAENIQTAAGLEAFTPAEAQEYNRWVRERFIGNYLSLATSLRAPGIALLQSLRFREGVQVPAGTLNIEVDGEVFTATLTAPAAYESAVRQLNASITSTSPNRPVVSFNRIGEPLEAEARYRLTVSTTLTAPGPSAPAPVSRGETILVRASPLATALGFPINQAARRSWVDPRNGDYTDRLMACIAREPCVPQRDTDGTGGANDGTCGRISECMEPGNSLLNTLFTDLHLRAGMPPMRPNQTGMCVPNGPGGARLTGDVCAQEHVSRRGSNRGFESTLQACPAGGEPTNFGGTCSSCSPGQPGEGGRAVPRLCTDDFDCNPELDCSGLGGCDFRGPNIALCTRRSVPFDGVPAGQGFCAFPSRSCATAQQYERRLPQWTPQRPEATRTVCRSPRPVDNDLDFEPATIQCVARGCAGCQGATGFQSYCVNDGECPSDHRCVTDTANDSVFSPACLLRPILGDGRFVDSARTTTEETRVPGVRRGSGVEAPLQSIVNTIDNGINSFSNGLRTLVPTRRASVIVEDIVRGSDVRRGQRILLYGIEARTTGASIRYVPDEESLPGAGDMLLLVFLDGTIRARGRVEGNFGRVDTAVGFGIDTDVAVRIDAQGLRIRVRPSVDYRSGQGRLRLRIIRSEIMRTLNRDGSGEAANNSHLTLEESSQLPPEFFDALRVFLFTHMPLLGLGGSEIILQGLFENNFFALGQSDSRDLLPLGDVVTAIPFTDPIGPLLFGEEILPFFQNTRLDGVAIQRADDFSTGAAGAASLGLYARRPLPAPPLSNRTAALANLLHTAGTDFICGALDQQSGDCLESTMDPTTCVR